MNKKNLIILLMIPFIIALLSIVTARITLTTIDKDIIRIDFDYSNNEIFKLDPDHYYELKAEAVAENGVTVALGNLLTWRVENKDSSILEPLAKIEEVNGRFFLITKAVGEVIVTCSNQSGNVSNYFTAYIYDNGVVVANPVINDSGTNIDTKIYYGMYDLKNSQKVQASFKLDIVVAPESLKDSVIYKDVSSNLEIDTKNNIVKILDSGKAHFTVTSSEDPTVLSSTYEFEVVENGVNVYTYEDLLNCTNRSAEGEIVVLRKSFESVDNALINGNELRTNNVEVFGNYSYRGGKYSFSFDLNKGEMYDFVTTFNKNYINEWNAFASSNSQSYSTITDRVNVGLRVQKDFYGNGFTINMHNLTYPYATQNVTVDGTSLTIPLLTTENKFRGPLPFYTLGDPNKLPLITAFGQDNIGMYVDGDNITINDLELKNCDFGNSLSNLQYTGTVLEINGDNVVVKNSRLLNGKNILRSFSNDNVLIYNSMLSYAMNFLIQTGSNNFIPVDGNIEASFVDATGTTKITKVNVFLASKTIDPAYTAKSDGDVILEQYLTKGFEDKELMRKAILAMHNAINAKDKVQNNFDGSMIIEDTLFYKSGIASISMDSLFNGPFLYSAIPSYVTDMLGMFQDQNTGVKLIPIVPSQVSGTSYPVKVELVGSTKFYDQKSIMDIDLSGLIDENMSEIAAGTGMLQEERLIDIDDIFPVKSMIVSQGGKYIKTVNVNEENKHYICLPVVKYGGGANLSVYDASKLDYDYIESDLSLNFLESYLNLPVGSGLGIFKNMMLKTVTTVTGYEPFVFACSEKGYLYGEAPKISELKENIKEDSK